MCWRFPRISLRVEQSMVVLFGQCLLFPALLMIRSILLIHFFLLLNIPFVNMLAQTFLYS